MKFLMTALCAMFVIPALSLNPSNEYKVTPDKFGMEYKEEKIKTKDGAVLNAWFYEAASKTSNWMVISGSGDGNMADDIEVLEDEIELDGSWIAERIITKMPMVIGSQARL